LCHFRNSSICVNSSLQICRCQQPAAQADRHRQDPEQRKAALQDALQNGLRVVIDCSYALSAQSYLEQQRRQQQQPQQIWGHQVQQRSDAEAQPTAHNAQPAPHTLQSHSQGVTEGQEQLAGGSQQLDAGTVERKLVTGTFIHKEIRSVAKQIELSAAINKRCGPACSVVVYLPRNPIHVHVAATSPDTLTP
jgi:hypothetical protein